MSQRYFIDVMIKFYTVGRYVTLFSNFIGDITVSS